MVVRVSSILTNTNSVTIQSFERNGKTVHLIDTPGFDDHCKDDGSILQELAFWLLQAYRNGFKLSGLVYLHRITDNHVQGSALRALRIFKAMCGAHCYPKTVMATTRWDEINGPAGHDRLKQLVGDMNFWGDIVAGGGRTMPLHWNDASALAIVDTILDNRRTLTLNIQSELASGTLALHETAAGMIVYEEYYRSKQRLDRQINDATLELDIAIRKHHDRHQMELRAEIDALRQDLRARNATLEALRAGGDQLVLTWTQTIAKDMGALKTSLDGNMQRLDELEQSRLRIEEDHRKQENEIQTTWIHPGDDGLIRAGKEGKLSGRYFKPEALGAIADVAGATVGLVSLITGYGSLAITAQQTPAAAAAALLCNVM